MNSNVPTKLRLEVLERMVYSNPGNLICNLEVAICDFKSQFKPAP